MPELPDVTAYIEALEERILGKTLLNIRLLSPFVLRTVEPSPEECRNKRVKSLRRIGKRIVIGLEDDLFLVIHLMIAGRFRWFDESGAKIPGKVGLAAFDFDSGTLVFTEAGAKKRASLSIVRGEDSLAAFDRGGLEVMEAGPTAFAAALTRENRTVKRALADPTVFSGIGNAYSDEILHRAKLSPLALTQKLSGEEIERLRNATVEVLREWVERLRLERKGGFPEKVTAFRPAMAAHGKFGQPCPVCAAPIQRIVYADNETNYCAKCQTGGKRLADRALSRLLGSDWPRVLEE